jgi:hypothetical protein
VRSENTQVNAIRGMSMKINGIDEKDGFVYILREPKQGWWKIGMSADPHRRFNDLKAARPDRLELVEYYNLGSLKLAHQMERHLHEVFRDSRLTGEWFSNIDLEIIRKVAGPDESYRAPEEIRRTFDFQGRALSESDLINYTTHLGGVPEETVRWAWNWMVFRGDAYMMGLGDGDQELFILKH